MEAVSKGAAEVGGYSRGYIWRGKKENEYLNQKIDSRDWIGYLSPLFSFPELGLRLCGLLSADGFIIAAGGGIGTFLELIATIQFNFKV